MVANSLSADPYPPPPPNTHTRPPDPRVGIKRSNSIFTEHSHVTYQIKGNHECSNMVANI